MPLTAAPMALFNDSAVGESDDPDDTAYVNEAHAEENAKAASDETENLSSMTAAELKALAKEKGIKGCSSMTKAELISALSETE